MRRHRLVAFDVAEDGTVELPDGGVIVSLHFEGEGPFGFKSRPVTAWADVPADAEG